MRLADIFFWCACFFLGGVLIASVASGFSQALWISLAVIILVGSVIFLTRRRKLAVFMVAAVLGAGYFLLTDTKPAELPFGQRVELTGVITEAEQRINSQKIVVENIQIATSRYPEFEYGDKILAVGVIKSVDGEWESYFKKEGVIAMMSFPKIELISKNNGSPIKANLLAIKRFFESSYRRVLPFEQAAFLSGLTLGSTAEFSDDFKEKLRLTGTTHLVALSGYNIAIIVLAVNGILKLWWVTKKFHLPISILVILGFVLMTGAEASVTRAAIMAGLALLADKIGRVYYLRNAIAAAALVMVLINPRILAFDIGFQLSFLALIGITHLEPWLRAKFKAKSEAGFLGWRSHFWTTTSAQLAVLPAVIYHFGFVSPVSIFTNVFLLEFIPITMTLGFFTGFAALIGYWFSWLIALPASVFLGYEMGIINLFSKVMSIF